MIAAQDLTKHYKKTCVLHQLSFAVPDRHILAICGANGAGKTTLLKTLALILKPDSGQVLIDGRDAWVDPNKFRSQIGYVPQANALFPELTVKENLDYWRAAGAAGDTVALLGLDGVLDQKASSLSGGMQRRLNLALGLMNGPRILIMDEPLTGVDIKTRQLILEWMTALKGKDITVIYSTHHTDEIAGTADGLLLMRKGRITYHAPLCASSGEERLAALFCEYV